MAQRESISKAAKGWSNPGISNVYEKSRPNYNLDSVEFLLDKVGALRSHAEAEPYMIVELGAGTGKFTRAVLKIFEKQNVKNFKIISTEPLKEMCETFEKVVPDVEIIQRAASDLKGIPNNCADTILAAQCFHCFALDQKALNEIYRVLKPEGTLGLIWNYSDRSLSWVRKFGEMLDPIFAEMNIPRPHPPDYDSKDILAPLRSCGDFVEEGDDMSYKYSMEMSREAVIARYTGISVVAAAPDD